MPTQQERMMARYLHILRYAECKGANIKPEQFLAQHFRNATMQLRQFEKWCSDMEAEIAADATVTWVDE